MHWSRSYKRVSHRICKNKDEIRTFQHLASKIEDLKTKEDVRVIFEVLAGEKEVKSAARFFTDKKLREGAKKLERHLRKYNGISLICQIKCYPSRTLCPYGYHLKTDPFIYFFP